MAQAWAQPHRERPERAECQRQGGDGCWEEAWGRERNQRQHPGSGLGDWLGGKRGILGKIGILGELHSSLRDMSNQR